jgi:hypothetical protein
MTFSLPDLLILSLATWRLAYMLAKENGPYNILTRLRARFVLGGLTACLYCLSLWVAALLYGLSLTPLEPVVWILAASGGALLLHRHTGADHV